MSKDGHETGYDNNAIQSYSLAVMPAREQSPLSSLNSVQNDSPTLLLHTMGIHTIIPIVHTPNEESEHRNNG